MNLADISAQFTTEDRCRELLRHLRWPDGVLYPRCKEAAVDLETDKELFYCKACDYQFSVTYQNQSAQRMQHFISDTVYQSNL